MAVRYKKTASHTDQLIQVKDLGLGGTTRVYTPGGGGGGEETPAYYSFRYYKMVITGTKITNLSGYQGGSGWVGVQFDELELLNSGARVDYTGAVASVITHGAYVWLERAIDNIDGTKWFTDVDPSDATPISFIIDFGAARQTTGFRYKTGNDISGRDPIRWTFQGSNDNSNWTTLHTQSTNATITDNRIAWTQEFSFTG